MEPAKDVKILVTQDGPYLVDGKVPMSRRTIVADVEGNSIGWQDGEVFDASATLALCRCGHSNRKPFCDGTHTSIGFDGTETATRDEYLALATEQEGPSLTLTDAPVFCAYARFCDVAGQVWNLVEQEGPEAARLTAQEAANCPSGRLVVWDRNTRQAIEPDFAASIGIIDDPAAGVAGPISVRGGITVVGVSGEPYEVRNRVTLCRCGESKNKPFCDASHASVGFHE